jgi:hypothetical protein
VGVVEVMPVAAFDGRWGWGYDGVHLYAVYEPYGGPEAFQSGPGGSLEATVTTQGALCARYFWALGTWRPCERVSCCRSL